MCTRQIVTKCAAKPRPSIFHYKATALQKNTHLKRKPVTHWTWTYLKYLKHLCWLRFKVKSQPCEQQLMKMKLWKVKRTHSVSLTSVKPRYSVETQDMTFFFAFLCIARCSNDWPEFSLLWSLTSLLDRNVRLKPAVVSPGRAALDSLL